MEWVLLIVLAAGDLDAVRIPFETESACMEAAEAFVEANPIFEFVNRPDLPEGVELLVFPPTVGCFPNSRSK